MTAPDFPVTSAIDSPQEIESLWGRPLQPSGCPRCKQVFLVQPEWTEVLCPSCAGAALAPQPALVRCGAPELLAPARLNQAGLRSVLEKFVNEVWLKPDDFTVESLLQRTRAVYWPMWLVDAGLEGPWKAEMGFDYQVKSSQEHYQSGGWQTTERVETRIRWEPRLGTLARHYDNVAVPATTTYQRLVSLVGNYTLKDTMPYQAKQIDRTFIHLPDVHPENAWPSARTRLDQAAAAECQQAAAAQHVRSYSVEAEYHTPNWTQLLLPLYVTYYTSDEGTRHPIYINAQNGQIGGIRLASQRRGWQWAAALGAGAVAAFVLALVLLALAALVPPAAVLGAFLVFVALALGVAAAIPAVWPWQWNRRQESIRVKTLVE